MNSVPIFNKCPIKHTYFGWISLSGILPAYLKSFLSPYQLPPEKNNMAFWRRSTAIHMEDEKPS